MDSQLPAQLVVELTRQPSASNVFSTFADFMYQLYDGLQHVSILVLPQEINHHQHTVNAGTGSGPSASARAQPAGAPKSKGGAPAPKQQQQQHQQQPADALPGTPSAPGPPSHRAPPARFCSAAAQPPLDWSNCCVFSLVRGRAHIVQEAPGWPVACTSGYHATAVAQDTVEAEDYAVSGPHFADWGALRDAGCRSMAAAPLLVGGRPVAALCMASSEPGAFSRRDLMRAVAAAVAPYCHHLRYITRRAEMQRVVSDLITPIAAQMAHQKSGRLARLGCSVQEAPAQAGPSQGLSSSSPGLSVCVGPAEGRRQQLQHLQQQQQQQHLLQADSGGGGGARPRLRGSSGQGVGGGKAGGREAKARDAQRARGDGAPRAPAPSMGAWHEQVAEPGASDALSRRPPPPGGGPAAGPLSPEADLEWGDFLFNLVSMCIVYAYFSKAAAAGESVAAVLLCMGVAVFDVLLLAMRWLCFEQYVSYGGMVLTVFQAYRAVVLPVANTWMTWSLLDKVDLVSPGYPLTALLGLATAACLIVGLQVRFFLHAPLQLASVLFAATSTREVCGPSVQPASSPRCMLLISALQLFLGFGLPGAIVWALEGRGGRVYMPHMQCKRVLMRPPGGC